MKGKAFIPLALGLGMGLVAVKLLVDTLQKAKGSTEEKQTVTVVRATQDIGGFEEIAAELVDTVETADNALVPTHERITSLDDVVGRVTAKMIPAGTPVLKSMLAAPGTTPGMVGKIPKGYRAFSVKIDEVSGVAYQLKPGDWVDVIALMDVDTGGQGRGKKETISKTILENVQLAAMGRATTGAPGDSTASTVKPAKSATLLVPKEEIPKLHLWQTRGKLTLAMRGDDRETTEEAAVAYESEMFGGKRVEPVVPTKPTRVAQIATPPPQLQLPHSVTVYRGSAEGKPTQVQQIIFEHPHSRNVVELRGGPVGHAEKAGRRSPPRTRAPAADADRTDEPQSQEESEFDDAEVE
ncbi:MAG: Flp pilus assembly protein CpaB [Phycisphaerales bacterium]|nr:MAG: Flp pilus assembly protein CpaB [Phycisphaerales bacterium]